MSGSILWAMSNPYRIEPAGPAFIVIDDLAKGLYDF
jgi:hypothetical protein